MNPATLLLCGFATGGTVAFIAFVIAAVLKTPSQKEDEP